MALQARESDSSSGLVGEAAEEHLSAEPGRVLGGENSEPDRPRVVEDLVVVPSLGEKRIRTLERNTTLGKVSLCPGPPAADRAVPPFHCRAAEPGHSTVAYRVGSLPGTARPQSRGPLVPEAQA